MNFFSKLKSIFLGSKENDSKGLNSFDTRILNAKNIEEIKRFLIACNFSYFRIQKLIDMKLSNKNLLTTIKKMSKEIFDKYEQFYCNNEENTIQKVLEKILKKKKNIAYFFGNNGVGKTTTIVRLGILLKQLGYKVLIIAADEFRGAAVEQVNAMSEENGISCFSSLNNKELKDTKGVVRHGLNFFFKNNYDVVLVDTSGRSHQDINLLEDLQKQYNIGKKLVETHENCLLHSIWINDSNIVNIIDQQMQMLKSIPIDYVIVTKVHNKNFYYNLLDILEKNNAPIIFYVDDQIHIKTFDKNFFIT